MAVFWAGQVKPAQLTIKQVYGHIMHRLCWLNESSTLHIFEPGIERACTCQKVAKINYAKHCSLARLLLKSRQPLPWPEKPSICCRAPPRTDSMRFSRSSVSSQPSLATIC